jgi:hypothetical protein
MRFLLAFPLVLGLMLSASADDRLDHAVKQTSAGFKPESENGSLVEIDHDGI